MADDVKEKDDEDWSEALAESPNDLESSINNSKLEVSSSKISELPVELSAQILQSTSKDNATLQDKVSFQPNPTGEKVENHSKNPVTPNAQKPPRSECHPRSRNVRQCQQPFQEIIGKHEIRNEELELLEGDLRQRLQTLESSMPAVMVWNIWRMAQDAPTSAVRRLIEKQFQGLGADDIAVPTTPSQHWDERVRKIEAERKEALRRAEEARALLAEKEAAVHEKRKRLEEAKKCNQEKKEMMGKLARAAAEQREALKNARGDDNSSENGEYDEIRKEKWLDAVGSVSSIGSTDLESFAKLQELAEAEICMKRQISELERREEAYMRTLQQADEMWSKMEGDTADTVSLLQDQLDLKTTANQQLADRICQLEDELENSKKKLISSKEALSKFTSKVFTEAKTGFDGSEADVNDRGVLAAVKTTPASTTAHPETFDQESLALPDKKDKESNIVASEKSHVGIIAVPKMSSKTSEAVPVPVDQTHRGIDPVTELRTETPVGDDTDIPEHWKNWNWDEGCPPDIICDDMVESSTATDECRLDIGPKTASQVLKNDLIAISPEELRNWYNIVDSVHHMIAKGDDCSSKTDDIAQLAERMKSHLRIKGVAGVKGPIIIPEEILKAEIIPSEEHMPGAMAPSAEAMPQDVKSAVVMDDVDLPKQAKSYIPEDEKEFDAKSVPLISSTEKVQEEVTTDDPTDHVDRPDESEPYVPDRDAKIGEVISPPTPGREEMQQEIKPEALIDHGDLPDETADSIPEGVTKIDQEIGPPTQSADEMQQKMKPEDLIDHEDLGDKTKSTIPEELAKTDKDISSHFAEQEETEQFDVLVSSEKGDSPEAAEDVQLPAEIAKTTDTSATLVQTDAETKPPEIVDEHPDVVKSQIDVSEQESAVADEKPPVSPEELPRVEEKAEDEIVAHLEVPKVEEEPAELPYEDSSSIAPVEAVKIPDSEKVEVKSEEIPDSDKLTVKSEEIPDSEKAEVTSEEIPDSEKAEVTSEEIPDSEKAEVTSEEIPDSEKAQVTSEEIPDSEKAEVTSEMIPDSEKVDVKSEEIPDSEKPKVESEEIPDSEKVEVKSEEIPDSEKVEVKSEEIPDLQKVDVKSEEIPDSEKVEVKSEEIPDSEKVEVESEEIPEPSEMISPAESVYTSADDFSEPEFAASVVADELATRTDFEEESSHIPEGETLIEMPEELSKELEDTFPISKEDAVEPTEQPEEFLPAKDEIEVPLELEVPAEGDATIEETPPSFVTPRTPPLSKTDIRKESKDEILAISDLKDDQSVLDVIHEKRSSEAIAGEQLEELLLTIGEIPDDAKEMPELVIEEPLSVEPEKVSITKTIDYKERPEIIDAKGIPELEVIISKTKVAVKADSETKLEIPEARSQTDVKETERPEDKLVEDIHSKENIIVDRPKARKPYLSIAKVESWKKLELPKPVGPCICKPRTCPLLDRSARRQPKLKVLEVVTSGTQTTPSIPKTLLGRMDKQKLKKLPESTRPSPEAEMWRPVTISPRRPKDKSTLTTVCVDTQTDSTLVRGRIALQGITRKDDCTCSGACPRKPDHGGCIQRISNRPTSEKRSAPVNLATAQLFRSTNFPTSMTSCAEKEISVVRYTGRSAISTGSHLDCIECGRPITPGGTVLSTKSTLPTTSKSQKSMVKSLKSMASSISRVTHMDGLTCCDCKTSGKLKTADGSKSKRRDHKDLDKRNRDQDGCCPCPSETTKKTSSKTSKKKRKPEMKDQAVMANIPKSALKISSNESKVRDVIKKKSLHDTSSKTKSSDTRMKIASNILMPGKDSYCSCDESIHENDPCNCFAMESVSKGSSCNCLQ